MTAAFESAQQRLLRHFGVAAESRYVDAAAVDGPAHVLTAGVSGPPVVMVPGFSDPAALWAPLMARLGGFRLYAVDRPSFGLTGDAEHTTGRIRELASGFLTQVLDSLGLVRPCFVANSIGSLWTFWLALDRPERVRAMAHVGCPAMLLGTSAPLPMRLLSVPLLGRILMRFAPPSDRQVESFARMVGADLSDEPEIRSVLIEGQKLPGAGRATRALLRSLVRLRGARPEVELQASELRRIRQPVSLVWGDKDPFGSPAVGAEAAELLPNATLEVVEDGGHVPWIGRAKDVADVIRPFLDRHAGESGRNDDTA